MTIKAIETEYAGHRFRSRLEARWAVFFDAANIEWSYEPQGFEDTESGFRYLPDFYLPKVNGGVYFEVKGEQPDREYKAFAPTVVAPKPLIFAVGTMPEGIFDLKTEFDLFSMSVPWHAVDQIKPGASPTPETLINLAALPWETPLWLSRGLAGKEHPRFQSAKGPTPVSRIIAFDDELRTARSARFEHGETPKR